MNNNITKLRPTFVPPILSPSSFENYTQYERIGILVSKRDNSEENELWTSSIIHPHTINYGTNNTNMDVIGSNLAYSNRFSGNNARKDDNLSLFGGAINVRNTKGITDATTNATTDAHVNADNAKRYHIDLSNDDDEREMNNTVTSTVTNNTTINSISNSNSGSNYSSISGSYNHIGVEYANKKSKTVDLNDVITSASASAITIANTTTNCNNNIHNIINNDIIKNNISNIINSLTTYGHNHSNNNPFDRTANTNTGANTNTNALGFNLMENETKHKKKTKKTKITTTTTTTTTSNNDNIKNSISFGSNTSNSWSGISSSSLKGIGNLKYLINSGSSSDKLQSLLSVCQCAETISLSLVWMDRTTNHITSQVKHCTPSRKCNNWGCSCGRNVRASIGYTPLIAVIIRVENKSNDGNNWLFLWNNYRNATRSWTNDCNCVNDTNYLWI